MSDKLRILHLTAGSDAGGLSTYIFDLCSAMQKSGHEVAVAGQRGAWHGLFEKAPWPWIEAPLKGGPLALGQAAEALRAWIGEHPVDLLHAHYRKATLVGRKLQKSRSVPLLYTLHLSPLSLTWPRRSFSDFGDRTHVASEESRRWLIESAGVSEERITLIPHGVDPSRFGIADAAAKSAARAALNIGASSRVAAFVGRLEEQKNVDWLLDLAGASRAKLPDLLILIAGQGPRESELRRRIEKDGLEDRVRLLGHQAPVPIYQAAEALLLPSSREGFSLVCAEAMATGIPVLRTQTAGTKELVIENVTGRSVAIDKSAFIEAAMEFLADAPTLARMGRQAADHIRQNFTFDRQLSRTLELYRAMVGRSTR
jgi:glycosyltransferase involved in cell wall biosynthesis